MQRELQALWRGLRRHDDVRCVVLTGAGEKAFCTGIDRMEQMGGEGGRRPTDRRRRRVAARTPFMFNDPGDNIGPKSCDLWKPVIARGQRHGVRRRVLHARRGRVHHRRRARHVLRPARHLRDDRGVRADPHVRDHAVRRDHATVAARQLRAACRRSARTRSGWSPKSCPPAELVDARRVGRRRSSRRNRRSRSRARCARSGRARELGQRQAVRLGYAYVAMGTSQESIAEGQKTLRVRASASSGRLR